MAVVEINFVKADKITNEINNTVEEMVSINSSAKGISADIFASYSSRTIELNDAMKTSISNAATNCDTLLSRFSYSIKLYKDAYEESKKVDDVFSKKRPIITYILIAINVIMYLLITLLGHDAFNFNPNVLYKYGALVNKGNMIQVADYLRLVSSIFLHGGLIHLLFNMYSLYIIGPQLESFFGKITH